MRFAINIYDFFHKIWEKEVTDKSISWLLIGTFVLGLLLVAAASACTPTRHIRTRLGPRLRA